VLAKKGWGNKGGANRDREREKDNNERWWAARLAGVSFEDVNDKEAEQYSSSPPSHRVRAILSTAALDLRRGPRPLLS